MFDWLEDLVAWFVSFVVLVMITAVVGLAIGLIHPIAGVIAGGITLLVTGACLSSREVERVTVRTHGPDPTPAQRSAIAMKVQERQRQGYVANQNFQQQQQQMQNQMNHSRQQHQRHVQQRMQQPMHRPFGGR